MMYDFRLGRHPSNWLCRSHDKCTSVRVIPFELAIRIMILYTWIDKRAFAHFCRSFPVISTARQVHYSLLFLSRPVGSELIECDLHLQGIYDLHIEIMGIPLLPWDPPEMCYTVKAR